MEVSEANKGQAKPAFSYRIEIIKQPGATHEEPLRIKASLRLGESFEEKESELPKLPTRKDLFSFLTVFVSLLLQRIIEGQGVDPRDIKHPILSIKPEGLNVFLQGIESLGEGIEKTKKMWIKLALAPELESGLPVASFEAWSEAGIVEAFCFEVAEGVKERDVRELSSSLMRYVGKSSLRTQQR